MQSVNLWNKSQWNSKIVRKWNNHTVSQWNNDMTCSITTTLPLYIYTYMQNYHHISFHNTPEGAVRKFCQCTQLSLTIHLRVLCGKFISHNTPAGAVWRMRGEPYYRHVKSHPKQGGRGEYEDGKGHAAVIVQSTPRALPYIAKPLQIEGSDSHLNCGAVE